MLQNEFNIGIVGLGYVGLPLAVEFGKKIKVIGFDINKNRIQDLKLGNDFTQEVESAELNQAKFLTFTNDDKDLKNCNIYIVTVPTPVDESKRPDFKPLIQACQILGRCISVGDIVIFESTVYPGATEEICVPELEKVSGLTYNQDFFCGYSPERINPGDKSHRLVDIKKITSGSNAEVAKKVDDLYGLIIVAGTHRASSIRVAEAAKVIENTQRDLNIALINELSLIFNKLNIDTLEVLEAAGTKWNFLPFKPGLVGGHCIGVDPYYLTHKAESVGYHPEVILAGRRINDHMPTHVAEEVVKLMLRSGIQLIGSKVLILGLTFKENCPDIRNTKVVQIVRALEAFSCNVEIYDPHINLEEAKKYYSLDCLQKFPQEKRYSAVVLAVGHQMFIDIGSNEIRKLVGEQGVLYDVKGIFNKDEVHGRL